ncbi:MAG TPA: DUF664 domain-containing protein [Nocardioides sp.]
MTPAQLLEDAYGRVLENGLAVVEGLDDDQLAARPAPDANSIAWLVWHLTRVQDDHVADVAGTPQVWTTQGYAARFALPLDEDDTGYGHSAEQVAAVRAGAEDLRGYLQATHDATVTFLRTVAAEDLDRVVDTRWDPPVTLGVRLVSVVDDGAQHVGQAAYVRGLLAAGD